jgi:hypothetical protein
MTDTTYSMNFDFTSDAQRTLLEYLQKNEYTLLGYKGASGPNILKVGVPTWFSVPFGNVFGEVEIDYTPKYKVYVFNKAQIAANTTIMMQSLSDEIGLGNALKFQQNGSFVSAGDAPEGSINLINGRPAGTPDLTVGLAGLVNLPTGVQYLPFCAFTLTPQGSITMTPQETIALFAARIDLASGNVQASAAAPGSTFSFSGSNSNYQLQVAPSTYTITNVPGTTPVKPVSSGEALVPLLVS